MSREDSRRGLVYPTNRESKQRSELTAAIEKIATDRGQQVFFKMTEHEIRDWLHLVVISDAGFDVSPNFQSPGWGENHSRFPVINVSDLG